MHDRRHPDRGSMSRRQMLRLLAAAGVSPLVAPSILSIPLLAQPAPKLNPTQDAFLDSLVRSGCLYFFEQASIRTGQVRDRASVTGKDKRRVASIAATGFGLSALCIADNRGYLPSSDIKARIQRTLQYHLEQLPADHGFLYHFSDIETGKRIWNCELSSIDTAIFICGVLTCRAHFTGGGVESQIRELATRLYERVDWPWMLNSAPTFSMGYKPESGFLGARWSTYCELMMLYLLAIGSPTHPISPNYWEHFARPYTNYNGLHYISDLAPLFTHQYSHAWFDFRNKADRYTNYFENSILATRAHKAFCIAEGFGYNDDYWGITASDAAPGYVVWGGPPVLGQLDGSVVPCAAGGSLPFLPQECLRVLMSLRQKYEVNAWGRYGFVDAFHPEAQWYDTDVLGIDQGITVLMAENLRNEFVWKTFMKNPEPVIAMQRCGFHPTKT